tara:strand:- start:31 stop:861 length:831 start_codon:yes stop_codon:yes gene_type:complete
MPLSNVTAGNTALAADLNQYKEALEGTRTFVPTIVAAAGSDITLQLSDAAGARKLIVENSAGTDGFIVDSNGVVTPTILQVNGVATPADTGAGRVSYDTTKNLLVYGNGTQVVEVADGASTSLALLSAEQTINNTTTLTTLTDFTTALVANGTYVAEFVLIYLSGTTPDVKFKWDITSVAGCTIEWGQTGASAINAAAPSGGAAITTYNSMHDQTQEMALSGQGTGADNKVVVPISATIHNSSTAGNLNMQWAQFLADGSNTSLLVGSYMKITRNA